MGSIMTSGVTLPDLMACRKFHFGHGVRNNITFLK